LVWSDQLEAKLEPQRHAVIGPAELPMSAYEAAARKALKQNELLSEIRIAKGGEPVVATASTAGSGRPARISIWINPRSGAVIDRASSNGGLLQVVHQLHGSLMVPGWGRTIVGWVGAFMFISCLTGIWLWWPLSGGFASGLRWRRRNTTNANLHYMTGFWILFPLAMLSFTGAWISFPKLFGQFENRPAPAVPAVRPAPLAKPKQAVDEVVAAADQLQAGTLTGVAWPTDQKPEWKVSYSARPMPLTVNVADGTGRASAGPPPPPETLARTVRRWHDGTGMGLIWQIIIFVAGIIPAILSITGIIIWWRARQPRNRARTNQKVAQTA
jgi:uncharacterized iron-regulated membrane protein